MRAVPALRLILILTLALLYSGCASHRAEMCPKPAKVVGVSSRDSREGWVIVRDDRSVEDTAERIATTYHVRTQPLTYLHGFSTYPVPNEPKFLCDKAVVEVHYASSVAAR
ncbi:MAG TPA: hypothetical protein VMG33_13130 [Steroidobacteraceae bacterium]|nr:hypothetical protein [Steroidobacteraceae bacterium]